MTIEDNVRNSASGCWNPNNMEETRDGKSVTDKYACNREGTLRVQVPFSSNICLHFDYCNVKVTGRNCGDYLNCMTWKFYHRFPDYLRGRK